MLRKLVELSFWIHTRDNTVDVRALEANRVTELKNFNVCTYGENSDFKSQPIGNKGSGKEIQVIENK